VLAAPPSKPPDTPFEDRSADSGDEKGDEQGKKQNAESKAAAAPSSDEATESEAPGEEGATDEEEPENNLHALACLEGETADGKRKGVQRRDFMKKHRFELGAVGGYYASDALSSTYSYGGAVAFYPSEDFGLEVLVTRTPIKFRLEEPFSSLQELAQIIHLVHPASRMQTCSAFLAGFKFDTRR